MSSQIDEVIAQDNTADADPVEFTPEALTSLIGDLKKAIKELEKHRDKLDEYDSSL